jgi:hypothetical protein
MSFLFGGFGVDIVGLRSEYSLPNGFVMKMSSRGGFGTSSKDIYDNEEFFIQSQQLEMCVRNKCRYQKAMTVSMHNTINTHVIAAVSKQYRTGPRDLIVHSVASHLR